MPWCLQQFMLTLSLDFTDIAMLVLSKSCTGHMKIIEFLTNYFCRFFSMKKLITYISVDFYPWDNLISYLDIILYIPTPFFCPFQTHPDNIAKIYSSVFPLYNNSEKLIEEYHCFRTF